MTPAERALIALFKQDRAHCAARAQDDEIEGEEEEPREPIPCRECGCLFVPSYPSSRVCSDACRVARAKAWQLRNRRS